MERKRLKKIFICDYVYKDKKENNDPLHLNNAIKSAAHLATSKEIAKIKSLKNPFLLIPV